MLEKLNIGIISTQYSVQPQFQAIERFSNDNARL